MISGATAFTLKEREGSANVFVSGERLLRVGFVYPWCVRVTYTQGKPFLNRSSRIIVEERNYIDADLAESPEAYTLSTFAMSVTVNRRSGALSYFDSSGAVLTREPVRGGKWLTPKKLHRNVFVKEEAARVRPSVDGMRAAASAIETVFDRIAFEAKLEFVFAEDEALFGLGSHEEGYGNLRGHARDLYQQNLKAVVPFLVSTRGYGVLLDCCSWMSFHDDQQGSYWWADAVDEFDFYVIQGDNFEQIVGRQHRLTGSAPMLPKWAFGYVQSKERYVNAHEMLDVAREYRRRRIPLDALILDWKSWPNGGGWGQKSFDPLRFPAPQAFISALHDIHVHLMASIWPTMTGGSADRKEMLDRNLMLGDQSTYNAFLAEARALYWQQAERGLFSAGIDGWWCDCTEPFEADWAGAVKPEPQQRALINTEQAKCYLDASEINAYSLLHSEGIYAGQTGATRAKRVVNLTRSAYAGQHRYATITWNGDICGTWESLRRSIAEGVHFCAAGEPYWTVDIGGFFIANNPELWFWSGDYADGCRGLTSADAVEPDLNDTGCRDRGYWELYTRWLQWATFLPMFRSHGTDGAREIWRFGEAGTRFYDTIARFIRLRYELMPYIYSLAAQVTLRGSPMVRAVALEYPEDRKTHGILDEYFFGPALLVCPVTEPMYYAAGSRALSGVAQSRSVYLSAGRDWFDFWTGAVHEGGKTIIADAPLETIPLFVPEGSILPLTQAMEYVDEIPDAPYEIRVYTGVDAEFTLYEDAGDGYHYEQGEFSLIRLRWSELSGKLSIAAREGWFPTMVKQRAYRIVFFSPAGQQTQSLMYIGEEAEVLRSGSGKQ